MKITVQIGWIVRFDNDFIVLVEGVTLLIDFNRNKGTISFLVLLILVHASCLLVELVLLKGTPGVTGSLISALLFRLLACMLSNLLKWCCPIPSVYTWNRMCFARNVVSVLTICGVALRYSLAQWRSSCIKIALYTNKHTRKKTFKR